jgi:hypothetical protein
VLAPLQRSPKIVVLLLQPIQPLHLFQARQMWFGFFSKRQEIGQMPFPNGIALTTLRQPVPRILTDRLKQPVTGYAVAILREDQALVREGCEQIQDIIRA